jgi:hypothetical protein
VHYRQRIESEVPAIEARDRLCRFMHALGYRLRTVGDAIIFERSSPLGFLPGAAPRSWECKLVLMMEERLDGSAASLEWSITTQHRLYGPWELNYFKREMRDVALCLMGEPLSLKPLDRLHSKAASNAAAVFLSAFVTMGFSTAMFINGDLPVIVWAAIMSVIALLLAKLHPSNAKPARRSASSRRYELRSNVSGAGTVRYM